MLIAMLALTLAAPALSAADEATAFKAAGFTRKGATWRTDCDADPSTAGYESGKVDQLADLNGDGLLEALITEASLYCYGNTGRGFTLVSKQPSGRWVRLYKSQGIPRILANRANGWAEIEVGGPGLCYAVLSWKGGAYAIHRHEYEDKPCRP